MKSMMTKLMLVMAIASVILGSALAGDLEPPGPPAPTMVTLQQVYDKLANQVGVVGVAKTGLTECWDASGTPSGCAGTGQDGEYQAGVSVAPRFTDNGDGTVKDHLTGLIWLQNANCFGILDWTTALSDANTLSGGACGLTDGSVAGAWRLPNLRELQSLIDYQHFTPPLPTGHPFSGVQSVHYWSSSTYAGIPDYAWVVDTVDGYVYAHSKVSTSYVWPVRGGQ